MDDHIMNDHPTTPTRSVRSNDSELTVTCARPVITDSDHPRPRQFLPFEHESRVSPPSFEAAEGEYVALSSGDHEESMPQIRTDSQTRYSKETVGAPHSSCPLFNQNNITNAYESEPCGDDSRDEFTGSITSRNTPRAPRPRFLSEAERRHIRQRQQLERRLMLQHMESKMTTLMGLSKLYFQQGRDEMIESMAKKLDSVINALTEESQEADGDDEETLVDSNEWRV